MSRIMCSNLWDFPESVCICLQEPRTLGHLTVQQTG